MERVLHELCSIMSAEGHHHHPGIRSRQRGPPVAQRGSHRAAAPCEPGRQPTGPGHPYMSRAPPKSPAEAKPNTRQAAAPMPPAKCPGSKDAPATGVWQQERPPSPVWLNNVECMRSYCVIKMGGVQVNFEFLLLFRNIVALILSAKIIHHF